MSQDQQNHSLIIHDKFEDLLQQLHRCQEFSHKDISAYGTSNARKSTMPVVQRYKAKHALRQNSTKSIKLFDFLLFMCFLDF